MKNIMTKEYIKENFGKIDLYDFDGVNFDDIISQLNDKSNWAKSEYPTMKSIYLLIEYNRYDGSDSSSSTPHFNVMIERLENDKEYNYRIKAEEKEEERKAKIAAREKTKLEKFEQKEYLRLQKKFGDKS